MLRDTAEGDIWIQDLSTCSVFHQRENGVLIYQYEGRYVGADGFVVPLNYNEFVERYPDYARAYAYKYMHRLRGMRYDADTFEEVANEMALHLLDLSPGRQAYKDGKRSYIECFDPVKQNGAKKGQFFNYLNMIMGNKFAGYVYEGLTHEPSLNGFSLNWTEGGEDSKESVDESSMVCEAVAPRVSMEDEMIRSIDTSSLLRMAVNVFPESERAVASRILSAFMVYDRQTEVAAALGVGKDEVARVLKTVRNGLGVQKGVTCAF